MKQMITYYRDGSVLVTSMAIVVEGRAFPLDELATVWHRAAARDAAGRRTLLSRTAFAVSPLAPLIAAAGVVALALRGDLDPTSRIVMLVIAGLLGLGTIPLLDLVLGRVERSYDRGTRVYEIGARWRDSDVVLLRTADKLRFGRIYRALQRAMESDETHRAGAP